jgi:hypothetical protein
MLFAVYIVYKKYNSKSYISLMGNGFNCCGNESLRYNLKRVPHTLFNMVLINYLVGTTLSVVTLNTGNNYWSSSENSSNNAWNVNTNSGNVNNNNKNNSNYVRAFLAV